jgi:hypothetical protein
MNGSLYSPMLLNLFQPPEAGKFVPENTVAMKENFALFKGKTPAEPSCRGRKSTCKTVLAFYPYLPLSGRSNCTIQ